VEGDEQSHGFAFVATSSWSEICSEVGEPASTVAVEMAWPLQMFSYTPQQQDGILREGHVGLFPLYLEALRNDSELRKGRELPSMPVMSCIRAAACTAVWGAYCPLTGTLRVHCCGLYGTEVFLIAIGEAVAEGEGAYVDGEDATKGEYGTLKFTALCDCCCCGAREVVSRGGCNASLRKGEVCPGDMV